MHDADKTGRKLVDEPSELRLLSRTTEQLVDPIILTNLDFEITYVNQAFQSLYGYLPEEILGRSPALMNAEPAADEIQADIYRAVSSGETWRGELDNRCKDGRTFPCELLVYPLTGDHGDVVAYAGSMRDITQRRQAEEELRETKEQFRRILENSEPVIFMTDADGIFLLSEGRSLSALGLRPGEVVGTSALEMYREVPAIVEGLKTALGGVTHRDEVEVQGLVWGTFYSPFLDGTGRVAGVIGMAVDLTERKRAEEERASLERQLLHAQKLESLGVLAGGIAHDFNNLLVGILGNADLALRQLSPLSPARDEIMDILDAARSAADLAKQMLAYSGKGAFVVRPIDLSTVVRETAHLLEASTSKNARIEYHLASDLPAIEADATELRQVVMNLITNASEAIGEGSGVISITTDARVCEPALLQQTYIDDELPAGNYVCLEVTDSGTGMDAETQAKIFDPFFTTKLTGRGLGLAALLGIVRGHQGAVEVVSESGEGTTVTVFLPASDKPLPPAERGEATEEEWSGSGTVLLVDDEQIVREVTGKMLERLGFELLTAEDGREGVELFRRRADEIAVVLLDLKMPRMGGEEALGEMLRIRGDAKVVLSSGYGEVEATERFGDQGLAGFIQKPYGLAELRVTMRQALELEEGGGKR